MPTTPRPEPRVDPELLKPIDGIPDKMNLFLVALAAGFLPDVQPAATVVQTSTTQVRRWREKSPEFDKRIEQIRVELDQALDAQIAQRLIDIAINKKKKKTTKLNADNEVVSTILTEEDDVNAIIKVAEARMPKTYGRNQQPELDGGPDEFTFNLGPPKELEAGPEAGEIIDEDPPDE